MEILQLHIINQANIIYIAFQTNQNAQQVKNNNNIKMCIQWYKI